MSQAGWQELGGRAEGLEPPGEGTKLGPARPHASQRAISAAYPPEIKKRGAMASMENKSVLLLLAKGDGALYSCAPATQNRWQWGNQLFTPEVFLQAGS